MHPEPNGRRGIKLALEKRAERHERGHEEEEKKSVPTKGGREPPTWKRADAQLSETKQEKKKISIPIQGYTHKNRYIHIDINHLHRYHKH